MQVLHTHRHVQAEQHHRQLSAVTLMLMHK